MSRVVIIKFYSGVECVYDNENEILRSESHILVSFAAVTEFDINVTTKVLATL